MKSQIITLLIASLIVMGCNTKKSEAPKIRVGVFDTNGGSPECITDALESLKIDPEIEALTISAAQIMSGELDDFDVLLFPGGSGRSQTNKLGEKGMDRIRSFVLNKGKGVVGICAGAYLLSNTPDYPCLGLNGAKAVDIEHDERGHGLIKFTLSSYGKHFFPKLKSQDTLFCLYYDGPIFEEADDADFRYETLARMQSDVHTGTDAPSGMTTGRPFILISQAGAGRTVSFTGHPERTPGMRWMVPTLTRWAAGRVMISYDQSLIKPDIYKHEIIYDKNLELQDEIAYGKLFGNPQDKITAINLLWENCSWSAKKWIPGMVRDNDPMVRLVATQYLERLECTEAIPDLEIAIEMEDNDSIVKPLKNSLEFLKRTIHISK